MAFGATFCWWLGRRALACLSAAHWRESGVLRLDTIRNASICSRKRFLSRHSVGDADCCGDDDDDYYDGNIADKHDACRRRSSPTAFRCARRALLRAGGQRAVRVLRAELLFCAQSPELRRLLLWRLLGVWRGERGGSSSGGRRFQGNANRFATRFECERTCRDGVGNGLALDDELAALYESDDGGGWHATSGENSAGWRRLQTSLAQRRPSRDRTLDFFRSALRPFADAALAFCVQKCCLLGDGGDGGCLLLWTSTSPNSHEIRV